MPYPKRTPLVVAGAMMLFCAGCPRDGKPTESAAPGPPGTLRFSDQMQQQLGLELRDAARREVANSLSVTGWLEATSDREATVKAPLAGFVAAGPEKSLPRLGQTVEKGERLIALQIFLTPQEIAQLVIHKEDADIAIEQSRVSMRLAQEQLERLAAAKDAVAGTRLAELKEILERSRAAYNESREKLPYLLQEPYDGVALVKPVPLHAPISGSLLGVHVAPNQFVIQGDPLWTIADWSMLQVRVPVFETDIPLIDQETAAEIAIPGTLRRARAHPLKVMSATKSRSRTVELLYEIRNTDLTLRAGQAVTVELPAGAPAEQVVIPRSAVLWDGLGNAWVYIRVDGESFRRQKIETGRLLGDEIVVTRGLAGGEAIVAIGAESLYGQEFKRARPADDDD